MARSSLDLSERATLGSLAQLSGAVKRAARETPVLLVGAAADARAALAHGPDREASLRTLGAILDPELEPDGALRLLGQMPPGDRERQLSLLRAFHGGLFDVDPSEG